MGRGFESSSEIQSRLQRSATQTEEEASDAAPARSDSRTADGVESRDLSESQEQLANEIAERMGRELPQDTGRYEPEPVANSEESKAVDPLTERLQGRADDPFNKTQTDDRLSGPEVTGPTRPESSYELFDPTTTRTGLDTFDNLGRPAHGDDSDGGGFDLPSLFQGKTGGPGYNDKVGFDDNEGLTAKPTGSFAENWPRLNKLFGQVFGTENAAGAKTPRGEALENAEREIEENSTPTPEPTPTPAPKAPTEPKKETLLEQAVREAAEEAAARAAEEAAAREAAAAEAAAREAAEAERKAAEKSGSTPPDDFVDPEKAREFSEYLRDQTGYKGPVRDGDIDWDDQVKDSTGGRRVEQSDLWGGREDGASAPPPLPDTIDYGDDRAINWGPDSGNPEGGIKDDVPTGIGREGDLSHLNPGTSNEVSSVDDAPSRMTDRTIRTSDGTPTPVTEGARRVAETSTNEVLASSSNQETTSTIRSMSTGGEAETVDLSGESDSGDDDEGGSSGEENVFTINPDGTVSDSSGTIISGTQEPEDNGTIVFTPGDGQPTDTVTIDTGDAAPGETDETEDDSASPATPVFTPVTGRVNAEDLRNLQPRRSFFDEEPAATGEDRADTAPEPENAGGDITERLATLRSSDLRVPSPLEDIQPLRTFELPDSGGSDDDAALPDDE